MIFHAVRVEPIARLSRFVLGGLWLVSAALKVWDPDNALAYAMEIGLGRWSAGTLILAITAGEAALGMLVLVGRGAAVMVGGASAVAASGVRVLEAIGSTSTVDCGCWGRVGPAGSIGLTFVLGIAGIAMMTVGARRFAPVRGGSWTAALASLGVCLAVGLGMAYRVDRALSWERVEAAMMHDVSRTSTDIPIRAVIVGAPSCGRCKAAIADCRVPVALIVPESDVAESRSGNAKIVPVSRLVWTLAKGRELPTTYRIVGSSLVLDGRACIDHR